MGTTVQNASNRENRHDAEVIASRAFADVFRAYSECNDAVQEVIRDMVEIVNGTESTAEEIDAALLTIAEALFPSPQSGSLGEDLDECEETAPQRIRTKLEEADADEAAFAERVNGLLEKKQMTQGDLAAAIGVGQPAVSMMLSRNCRPQRRTIEKIATALGVSESEIWPARKEPQT
jgi:predicted XRE-type DNA-binding protein